MITQVGRLYPDRLQTVEIEQVARQFTTGAREILLVLPVITAHYPLHPELRAIDQDQGQYD